MSTFQFLAHPSDRFGNGLQPYSDHILGVMTRAGVWFHDLITFANFNDEEVKFIEIVIALVAVYHDLGKLDVESQRLLSDETLLKKYKMVNHVDAGVRYCALRSIECKNELNPFTVAAYIIHAHHLGLGFSPNSPISFVEFYQEYLTGCLKKNRYDKAGVTWNKNSLRDMSYVTARCHSYSTNKTVEDYVDVTFNELLKRHDKSLPTIGLKENAFDVPCPMVSTTVNRIDHGYLEHVIRLILSIIVEADHGDTASSAGATVLAKPRIDKVSPTERLENVQKYRAKLSRKFKSKKHSPEAKQKQKLREMLQDVVFGHDYSKGDVFIVNAVVGCGKTIASLIAALRIEETYKAKHGKSALRIHYVSPLNAPGKQAKDEFIKIAIKKGENKSKLVGENYHDSNYKKLSADGEIDEDLFTVASKNWDFPITVSSCEQFLLTINGNRTASLRKYAHLANSVIIIDEYQALPLLVLKRLWNWMVFASKKLNIYFVLVSGTPTNFCNYFNRGELVVETVSTTELDFCMDEVEKKRVKYVDLGTISEFSLVDKIASETELGNTLTVVQTTVTAAYLYTLLVKKLGKDRVIYVSRGLCNVDVDKNIELMKARLKNNEKFAVVSTSMLEAGIDVSFGSVFGEYSRFTSIIQLGGRCNRHGERETGLVYLFGLTKKKNLITINPKNNLNVMILKQFLKEKRKNENGEPNCEDKLSYKFCGEAFSAERKLLSGQADFKKYEEAIREYVHFLNFGELAKYIHAIDPEHDGDDRTDMSIVIKSKAEESGVWQKLLSGDVLDSSAIKSVSVTMKPSRADKLSCYIRTLAESDMVITINNKKYIDMTYWEGPYDEIGYISSLLDPVAFE
jgi:hypothetical protein